MNFVPRKHPMKEGRHAYPGGLPYGGPGPGRGTRRILAIIVLVGATFLFLTFLSGASLTPSVSTPLPGSNAVPKDPIGGISDQSRPAAGRGTVNDKVPFKAPAADKDVYVKDEEPARYYKDTTTTPSKDTTAKPGKGKGYGSKPASNAVAPDEEPATPGSKTVTTTGGGKVKWVERPRFERALSKVLNMLPGEMHMRDLLRPVDGTGKERIREMGLRTRAYKSYFEAWEDLHLDTDAEGGSYVRDDVVQYMRSHAHQSSLEGEPVPGLEQLDMAQQIRTYESYRYFLAKFGQMLFPWTAPYFSDHMSLHSHFKRGGRGIVLTAGDDQAPYLLTSIPMLREIGCNLPVEVMYLGDSDLGDDYRQELEAMDGVITRDIAQMVNDEGWRLAGWAAKPFAILFSSFREVIFIDADSLFFKNPEMLFSDPGYKKTGALFFKDRMIMPENKKRMLQQILPKPISKQVKQSRFWLGTSGHMQESGVVVVDKWKHFIPLLMVTRMNGPDRDGNKDEGRIGVYDLVYGDKETFWLAWELVGDPDYVFHGGDAGIMGDLNRDAKTTKEREEEEQRKGEEWTRKKEEARLRKEEQQKKDEEEQKKLAEERERKEHENENKVEPQTNIGPPAGDQPQIQGDSQIQGGSQIQAEEVKQLRKRDEPAAGEAPAKRRETDDDPEDAGPSPAPPAPGPTEHGPESYTLCSPQLLHLDTDGTPLWFNGWLLDNKFADKSKKKFGTFLHYLIEPTEIREPTPWQLHENNECCLTVEREGMRVFSEQEKHLLKKMMDKAREVGAPGS